MRKAFLFAILISFTSCLSPFGTVTGDMDTRSNAEKVGMNCENSTYQVINKSNHSFVTTIDSIDYLIEPSKKWMLFNIPSKTNIALRPGYHDVYDNMGDHVKLEFLPCMKYTQKYEKNYIFPEEDHNEFVIK